MTHRHILELAAGAVLDDLDPRERATMQAHLARCPACRVQARELDEVIVALGLAGPRRDPPPELWGSIRAAIRAMDAGSGGTPQPDTGPTASR